MIGKKFARLTVLSLHHKNGHTYWNCACDCGSAFVARQADLNTGRARSCGCLRIEAIKRNGLKNKTHGLSNTLLYHIYRQMVKRCSQVTHKDYHDYGARGIRVCEDWLNDIKAFFDWANSAGYEKGYSIDRINNSQGYSPDNCRWVSPLVQANNKRNNHLVVYKNITRTMAEWSRVLGINYSTIRERVYKGLPLEKAF